jgi:hypothetical protein
MRLEDKSPYWQNSPKPSVSKLWLAFVYSVPTRNEAFRFQGRHKQQVWAYEPWNAGLVNTASMAWLASFDKRARIVDGESCRQKQ